VKLPVKMRHNENAYNDLQFFDHIFNSVNHTVTCFGKQKLRHRMAYCMTDSVSLDQMVTKNYMIHLDTEYRDTMNNNLKKIKLLENDVMGWMNDECDKKLLFDWNILNNRVMLRTSNALKYMLMFIVAFIYLFLYLFLYWQGFVGSPVDFIKQMFNGFRDTGELLVSLIVSNYDWIEIIGLILAILYTGYITYSSYQSVVTCYEHYNVCTTLCDQYDKITEFVRIVEMMHLSDTYISDDENEKITNSINEMKKYFTDHQNIGYSLITKLGTSDYLNHMNILVNYVGRIDYQLSVCGLIDMGYGIPSFASSTYPILHIDNVWSPVLHSQKIQQVTNSIAMNLMTPNIMIITGPNAAGKSTFMKNVMINVYLSQSLGICCSEKTHLTPFENIFTYLNITDQIGKESLFQAEMNRCFDYVKKSELNVTEGKKIHNIGMIDELFTGTNPDEGMAGSYAVLNRLAMNPMNLTLVSTHYHQMVKSLDKNNFMFCKFSMDSLQDNGKEQFVTNYKISPGISDQLIALNLLEEKGFDKFIIDDALKYLNNAAKSLDNQNNQNFYQNNQDDHDDQNNQNNHDDQFDLL
jgi:DNA mismatch repair ATPase MutS